MVGPSGMLTFTAPVRLAVSMGPPPKAVFHGSGASAFLPRRDRGSRTRSTSPRPSTRSPRPRPSSSARPAAGRARWGPHHLAASAARAARGPRTDRPRPLRRPPRHLGHLLRGAVHARDAVPPRLRGGTPRQGPLRPCRHPRTALRPARPLDDADAGSPASHARDLDALGVPGVVDRIRARVGDCPSTCRSTSTSSTRRSRRDRNSRGRRADQPRAARDPAGLADLRLVGADIVEVAPAYDHAEVTAVAAATSPTTSSASSPCAHE